MHKIYILLLTFGFLGSALPAAARGSAGSEAEGTVRLLRDEGRIVYGVKATNATLQAIAAALAQELGCAVEVDRELRSRRLTLNLSPRPPERLFPVLARRAGARFSNNFRFTRRKPGVRQGNSRLFAREPVSMTITAPAEFEEVLQALEIDVDVAEEVAGKVTLATSGQPLATVLSRLAHQVDAVWEPVVRLEYHKPVDAEAASYERMLSHFSELAALSPAERREEIQAELESLGRLGPDEQPTGIARLAGDILSLGSLLRTVPGEHRAAIGPQVVGVAADYWAVLSRAPGGQRSAFRQIVGALGQLARDLEQIR